MSLVSSAASVAEKITRSQRGANPSKKRMPTCGQRHGECGWMDRRYMDASLLSIAQESSERGRLPVNFALSAARFLCAAINFYVGTLFRQRSSFSN
jgi:hypothetical protein